ncbi:MULTISPECIES: hypothetical protein [unclassified Microcoleus]|uniref:hypothetical protein n=1 Tax=unclassified Microcoleus TaxID=2642155 RepID=UPI002FD52F31
MSTSGNFTVLVATIIDSCSLLKRDLTADSGGYSSKHYYYSPGNLDAFALVRQQMLEYLSPKVAIFLSKQ